MEKSIETIWKNGFIKDQTLIAPRVIDVYNQKSKNSIDELLRKMKKGAWVIVILALLMIPFKYIFRER